ncbi:MAG: helix-turn-helix domain-containing protein [Myxococcus sp.]|nr:helix-turn-helix domain-containing protein [Myxococcus sp.]
MSPVLGPSPGVAGRGTEAQAFATTGKGRGAESPPLRTASTASTSRGAPVVRKLEAVLTVREVAALLRVSTATVYAMVERGELEHFRVVNSIRVPRSSVERLVGRES